MSQPLAGNIDIEFPLAHGTPEDVDKDVKEHMEVLKQGGGYVAACSHSIVNYIPHENYIAMINAFHKYGIYEKEQWFFGEEGLVQEPKFEEREKIGITKERGYRDKIKSTIMLEIYDVIFKGKHELINESINRALNEGYKPMEIIDGAMTPAIKEVGDDFSTGELFLPDLILAANTMQEAMKILSPLVGRGKEKISKGKILIGTVQGDLHDIGKNMVKALLRGNGFEVIDIGVNNAPEDFIKAINEHKPDVVGYSGLLSTTLGGVPDQIEALKKEGLRDKVITAVGGAPVTKEFAERNGIDLYGKDANEAVKVVEKALEKKGK